MNKSNRNLDIELRNIQSTLKDLTLGWVPILGDGNCLFASLSSFFAEADIDHRYIRKRIVRYIQHHPLAFETDILANGYHNVLLYCNSMSKIGFWGDGTCLQAFCKLSQLNVWLVTGQGFSQISDYGSDKENIAVIHWGNHYDATTPL